MSDLDIRAAREAGNEEGWDQAIEAIVKWLRDRSEKWPTHSMPWETLTTVADDIQNAEHFKLKRKKCDGNN